MADGKNITADILILLSKAKDDSGVGLGGLH